MIKLLQSLQEAYSSLTGLTIMIRDLEGNPLTQPSGLTEIASLLLGYHNKSVEDSIVKIMDKVKDIEKLIVYETTTGFKLLVMPVRIKGRTRYFIVAGVYVEDSNRGLIEDRISEDLTLDELIVWKNALKAAPAYHQEKMSAVIVQLEELAEMIEKLLDNEEDKRERAKHLQLLNLTYLMNSHDPSWLQGILGVFTRIMKMEFAGFARQSAKEEQYTIIETVGFQHNRKLQGESFFQGEGLLGQVGLTKQMSYWERSDRDPRVSFFTKRGIEPKVIICYPIKYKEQFFGLLFAGDSVVQELSEEQADLGALLANQLAIELNTLANDDYNERRENRMQVFRDISQGVLAIKDKDNFYRNLIDSLQRTFNLSFICLMLKRPGEENRTLYASSGSSEEQYSAYALDVENNYFGEGNQGLSFMYKPAQRKWNGINMLEVPLLLDHKLYGILGITINEEVKDKENRPLLNAMNAIVITRLKLESQASSFSSSDAAALLHQALLVWNPQAYYKSVKIKELAQAFLKQVNGAAEDLEWIGQAGLLLEYDPDMLSSSIGENPAVVWLRQLRRYTSGDISRTKSSETIHHTLAEKIFCIVLWYYEHGEKNWLTTLPCVIDEPLKHSFELFISTHKELVTRPLLERHFHLTPREEEILQLVLQGLNNLEISEKLFISSHTVKNHITKIYEKLEVSGRAQAIAKMYQAAVTDPVQKR
ncbi:LuxR C-terminal-related transcriptional regulator [Paenibacillus sp. sgz500958]|uniref:LuxR C-terminal-related transcriptional regulator n=1 Tax=Paenibacillus sp. sgz500958 TaxID=3242475 RepID=UPI0036D41843